MSKNILVTGGAGFIGSNLVDDLIKLGHNVTVYDCLVPENYGENATKPPEYLSKDIEFIQGNVTDYEHLKIVVRDKEVIYHLAAALGIGKSMYEIPKFVQENTLGTSNLLQILANEEHDVKKYIVASSNSIYGEGLAKCNDCGVFKPKMRTKTQLDNHEWELKCPKCGKIAQIIPTPETTTPDCTSIYAHTKMHQEQLSLLIGEAYGINTTALRFFNVLGPRQALSNPYTGVCAIFSTSLLCGNSPLIYEDGKQSRDFVNVKDINQGLVLAMEKEGTNGEVFNLGTGRATSILKLAEKLSDLIAPDIRPIVNGKARFGDTRHCYADISKAKKILGYEPKFSLEDSLKQVIEWIKLESKSKTLKDKSKEAESELKKKGIL